MKALIIYDDVTRAANTNAILHQVAHRADMAVNWDIRPWRLNMLKLPATAGLALRDAADAQLGEIPAAVTREAGVLFRAQ